MADASSNADEVEAWENAIIDSMDFTRPGVDQSLGRDMAGDAAMGIIERTTADQRDATGGALKANEPKYAARKAREYDAYQPLIRTGQMLSLLSVRGEVAVAPDEVVMTYGINAAPSGGGEDEPTDRQKAEWNSGERPFFALDDAIVDRIAERASEALDALIKERS